jgi:hypothetical protein
MLHPRNPRASLPSFKYKLPAQLQEMSLLPNHPRMRDRAPLARQLVRKILRNQESTYPDSPEEVHNGAHPPDVARPMPTRRRSLEGFCGDHPQRAIQFTCRVSVDLSRKAVDD